MSLSLGLEDAGPNREVPHVRLTVRRWQELSGEKAKLDGDGRTFEEIAKERRSDGINTKSPLG